jgi:pimeloyl-ACP methyl ester carboxylesterase
VTVQSGVSIEVLDWGGRGRPLIIIPGGWVTAHSFDRFAPKLVPDYHVFVLTRRGSGASSNPDSGYDAYRLGDDVLAVMDSLRIVRPVLVGHSLGGLELSSIGSRFPERVSGLVYLDAIANYSFYDREHGDFGADLADLKSKIDSMLFLGARPLTEAVTAKSRRLMDELIDRTLPEFERSLRAFRAQQPDRSELPDDTLLLPPAPKETARSAATMAGLRKFTTIRAPTLAILADPSRRPADVRQSKALSAMVDRHDAAFAILMKAYERANPHARVVRIQGADHAVYNSNEADVLREMKAFISTLPP